MPTQHMETNALAVLHQLEAIKRHCPECRYYNAGSSEEFGDVITEPQTEEHPLRPRSPYGASKCSARHLVKYIETHMDYTQFKDGFLTMKVYAEAQSLSQERLLKTLLGLATSML